MSKIFLFRLILATGVFPCIFAFSALAQNASPVSTPAIGPAPANTPQHHILTTALSPETRQTLQEAMDSARAADTTHPVPPAK